MSKDTQESSPDLAQTSIARTPMVIALILAVVLVLGVLTTVKIVTTHALHTPITVSQLPAQEASSTSCHTLLNNVPSTVADKTRATLADPIPEGVAAWVDLSDSRIVLRCGVDAPLQYTNISATTEIDGTQWLRVRDITPGSSLETWYAVSHTPIVAITADNNDVARTSVETLSEVVEASISNPPLPPGSSPLAELVPSTETSACERFIAHLPETIGTEYTAYSLDSVPDLDARTAAAYTAEGLEPIVLRCDVAMPEDYAAGASLQQINDIPWFNSTIVANGTTTGLWYALGRDTLIATSLPEAIAATALTTLSTVVAQTTESIAQ